MKDIFWDNGIGFLCTRCSACCCYDPGYVFLYEKDIPIMLQKLNITYYDFVERYCRWILFSDGYEYLTLKEKTNYDCIFWENGCSIYQARPLQCKAFPFWPTALRSVDAWNATISGCKAIIYNPKIDKKLKHTDIPFFSPAKILELRNEQETSKRVRRAI